MCSVIKCEMSIYFLRLTIDDAFSFVAAMVAVVEEAVEAEADAEVAVVAVQTLEIVITGSRVAVAGVEAVAAEVEVEAVAMVVAGGDMVAADMEVSPACFRMNTSNICKSRPHLFVY